ncbi:unnamed protein product [Amaranthus hypochondriacus]
MGCGTSKPQDLPLVNFCKERRDLIKSASDHRFALAAAHIAYFRQLKDVGDSLCRFVEEELILSAATSSSSPSSPSSLSSPVLTLPSDEPKYQSQKKFDNMMKNKKKNNKKKKKNKNGSSSTSISHNLREMDAETVSSLSCSDDDEMGSHHHHHSSHSGHLDIDDDDEDGDEKKEDTVKNSSPQPGISYIPDSEFSRYSNYPFPYESYGHNPYNDDNNGVIPPHYYANPAFNSNYSENGYDNYYNYNNNKNGNNAYGSTTYTTYYMKKSATRIPSVIYEEPKQSPVYSFSDYGQSSYTSYPNFAFSVNSDHRGSNGGQQPQQRRPPTPPSPKVSAWDYFNPFETSMGGGGYSGYYGMNTYGYGSNTSSPDSREVREREGIPELEEETESEVIKEPYYPDRKKVKEEVSFPKSKNKTVQFEDGMGKNKKGNVSIDRDSSKGGRSRVPQREEPQPEPVVEAEKEVESIEVVTERSCISSSPESEGSISTSLEDISVKKKGVSFDMDGSGNGGGGGVSSRDIESSKPSSTTTLSAHGTRDLREVVREIKDEFEAATDYGKEVSVLLEVGKEPYKSRPTFLKVILARFCSTSLSSSYSPSSPSERHQNGEEIDSRSLASTLERLYVWEKKLYKEVKDEERLRVMYEKQCRKLKTLDDIGAETCKIEATQASIRKLLTKINVSVRAVDSISRRIHRLRDEELQPRMKELIYGLRKMWKLMLKCHRKQFQAILESKTRALKANIGLRRDSSVRATIQLEAELLKWCHRFNNWVEMQRSYADKLNRWLEKCIQYEPEVTPDGIVPFSPARIGAPPIFVICHDWKQAMETVSGSEVQTAMNDFATSLHHLWERQDEEQRRRVKAENMYKDFEKQIRGIRMDKQRRGHDHDDALSDKNSLSLVASESGISPLDDLKVDLDSMRQRVRDERAGHKEAIKLVHDAVSRTIQAGLIPIFESLESFTSEASKAFDNVRLEHKQKS